MIHGCGRAAAALVSLAISLTPAVASAEWVPNGNPVQVPTTEVETLDLASDGRGGVLACWTSELHPRAQHFDSAGDYAPGWSATGRDALPGVTGSTHWLDVPVAIVPDGSGGAYMLVEEWGPYCFSCDGSDPTRLYVHRLTAEGAVAHGWTPEGVPVDSTELTLRDLSARPPLLVSDGRNGVFVVWARSFATNSQPLDSPVILTQSIRADGTRPWGDGGAIVDRMTSRTSEPAAVRDGERGIYVFWADTIVGAAGNRIMGQHVLASGRREWRAQGLAVSRRAWTRLDPPVAVPDRDGGAIVGWSASMGDTFTVHATRVAPRGTLPWRRDANLCDMPGNQTSLAVTSDGRDGAIFAWRDGRAGAAVGILAQALSQDGRLRWAREGVPMCLAPGDRGPILLVSDGDDGAYGAWADSRPQGELFASRLTRNGRRAHGWPENGAVVSPVAKVSSPPSPWPLFEKPTLVAGTDGTAFVGWLERRDVPTSGGAMALEMGYVMLLTPEGPAAAPAMPQDVALPATVADAPAAAAGPAFALRGIRPNPSSAGAIVGYALPDAQPATLEMFDVSGRRVWSREVGAFGPGVHEARLRDGAWSPPGLYLVRLRQGERIATMRVTMFH